MNFHFLNLFADNFFVHAVFKTLAHSVWQGIILAVLAGFVLASTKKSATALRYKLFICLLTGFIITSIATFYYEINTTLYNNSVIQVAGNYHHQSLIPSIKYHANIIGKLVDFFLTNENIIVLAWCLIVLFKSLKFFTGLYGMYRLKTVQVSDAGEYWNEQLKKLCVKLNLSKPVKLLKSGIAEMPMVIGHFKPVILFPAAALLQLSSEQVEAILLHELAHICRKDFLINLLQVFAEVMFFFNPAVLWVSNLLKDERENCCDDIAIAQVKNKKQFIRALVSFQEFNLSVKYATSFSGRKKHLFNRIKRIITNNNKTLNNMEKILLATGIICTSFIAIAFTQKNSSAPISANANLKPIQQLISIQNIDTTAPKEITNDESKTIINENIDDKHYKLIEVNGKVSELYVDDNKIPEDKLSDYRSVIETLENKFSAEKARQIDEMNAQKEKMNAQSDAMKKSEQINKQLEKEMQEQAELINKQALVMQEKIDKELQPQREVLEKQAEILNAKAAEFEKQMQPQQEELEKQEKVLQQKAEEIQKAMQPQREELEKQAEILKQKAMEFQKEIQPQKEELEKQAKAMQEKALEIQKSIQPKKEELEKQTEILKQKIRDMQQQMMLSDSTHV